MTGRVVDTNVGIVANGRSKHASPDCETACVDFLEAITTGRYRLVLDDGWWILREYQQHLRSEGQPGPGDAFLRWVLQNRAVEARCEMVPISPDPHREFVEFPSDPDLEAFDRSDRKFVAVALASPSRPAVANATDSDWWHFREALERAGVDVELLCDDQVRAWMGR